MVTIKKGNIFTTKAKIVVNTVNCVGVMGAGIAFEFKLRNPKMFEEYQKLCKNKKIQIGKLWLYENILNFPTKYDWKFPSKEEYLTKGLQEFIDTHHKLKIDSIAFPLLGADKGGILPERSLNIMREYLDSCQDVDIEIWKFDPKAKDDLYESFKKKFTELDNETIKEQSKIRPNIIETIRASIDDENINSLSALLRIKGVGEKSLEKLFAYIQAPEPKEDRHLFN